MEETLDHVRQYWDADAPTYDRSRDHRVGSPAERAAWNAALARCLPDTPARLLDVGAGTGFLSLLAAGLGHRVTALDIAPEMLARLSASAESAGLEVEVVVGAAHEPPDGPFDAVMERHLLWTVADPGQALRAWRAVAPAGRLASFEGLWGAADTAQSRRQRARELVRRVRRMPPAHHGSYDPSISELLPFGSGVRPEEIVEAVEAAGWHAPRLERLRDVEWTRLLALPPAQRLLGTTPQYLVTAR